jgi:hypothetical protein
MSSENRIEIDVLLEFRDYLRANYWFLLHRFKLLFVILFVGGVVYPLLLVSRIATQNPTDHWWAFFIPWAMLLFLIAGQYFNAKKHMASNKALSETIHYVFSQAGINATAASSSGSTAWQNVFEAHETGRNFLIFISKNMMYTIPKRCFHSTEQLESFKALLRAQLGAKAKWK